MPESLANGGPRHWFFPVFDQPPRNLSRDSKSGKFCAKCKAGAEVHLEEGPFELPTAAIAWVVEFNARNQVKSQALLLEQPPKARPAGKRKVRAACSKCRANILAPVRNVLHARGMLPGPTTTAATAPAGIKRPPFKVEAAAYAPAECTACGKSGRVIFRPASRYRVTAATLRANVSFDATLPVASSLEIVAARKLEAVGHSKEITVSCGHCAKPLFKALPKKKPVAKKKEVVAKSEEKGASRANDLAHEAQALLTAGRLEEALMVAARSLAENPKQPRALLVRALSHFKLKNFNEAVPVLKELKRADVKFAASNDADAWLGATYEALGRRSEAASSFRAKLKQKPRDPSATLALCRVLLLRDGPTGEGMKLLKLVARIPVAKDRALVDPRLAALREHPAIRAVLGLP